MRVDNYGKLCTEAYDLDKPEAPPEELEFYSRLHESAMGPVLESMCGSGRFLIPLLERGTDIDGVDASVHMLQACRDKAALRGLRPVLYHQLLQELDLPRRYGFVFIPAGSFGLIVVRQEAADSLRRLYDHLLPGGRLVLNVLSPRAAPHSEQPGTWAGRWGGGWVTRPDGAKIVLSHLNRYDPEERLQESNGRYELFEDGRLIETELESLDIRHYEPDEFQGLLEAAGFAGITATRPSDDADAIVVFECSRPE